MYRKISEVRNPFGLAFDEAFNTLWVSSTEGTIQLYWRFALVPLNGILYISDVGAIQIDKFQITP